MKTDIWRGYFGKMPQRGDFVARGLPRNVENTLDQWLRGAMRASQSALGTGWLDAFLVAPVWRLALPPGIAGPHTVIGVMMPSVDRIGRYFPFIIAAALPPKGPELIDIARFRDFFDAAEDLALSTLGASRVNLPEFDERIDALPLPDWPLPPEDAPRINGPTLWWTADGQAGDTEITGLPAPEHFHAVFMQASAKAAPPAEKETPPPVPAPTPAPERPRMLAIDYAEASLKGTRNAVLGTQTAVNADCQVFSLISGIGDVPGIGAAIRDVVPLLQDISSPFSMNDLLADAKGRLGTMNTMLQVRGSVGGHAFAASTVVLLVQAQRYAILWAGDAQAFLLRQGELTRLTRPHVDPALRNMVTRAVGAAINLSPDSAIGRAEPGDRFILVSPGLLNAIGMHEMGHALNSADQPASVVTQLTQDALIAGAPVDASALAVFLSEQTRQP
ncbi:type VI secretion system-associated protein TagF [Thalassococcus sp. S3]|uniref:type VI secretion system-associated protein TagF n=1 Tax=Thalassococcus sp. S3 TaxID=2017482 RepID=UPI0013EEB352|nr:type VI secretion system-associated protein TagF [Thalassococcus sp. S3]